MCHSEGNGSFLLINISDKAVPAHRRHADALPGEGVPGVPGTEFDEFCDQVLGSTCPCDFSATGLAEVGIDGSGDETCNMTFSAVAIHAGMSMAEAEKGASGPLCFRDADLITLDDFRNLTVEQADNCIFDLLQADACQP